MIDRESGIPYYCQLMDIVNQQIDTGVLKEGERIPSELEMSGAFRVNRHTVRQAVGELCRTGVLYKIKGRGTFVAKPPLDLVEYRLTPKNRFSESIYQAGKIPGSRLLRQEETVAPADVAKALALKEGETVYVLDILRFADSQPFLLSKTYLPAKHLPELPLYLKEFASLFAVFEKYGIVPIRVRSQIRATFATAEEALVLDIPGNMPVLKVENLLKTQDNILIEYNVACYRGDLAKISIDW
ncbi:MAG: phosphonate metabolism transcriptional regulator PhnF [Negativicutes bacterium]|nr:phosphonate metabolism transcriptional regulator PhnF [Negativicutes bacterium]